MSTYQLSQRYNFQTALWGSAAIVAVPFRLLIGAGRLLFLLCWLLWACTKHWAPIVATHTAKAAPWLLGAAVVVGAFLVIFAYPLIVVGAGIIAAYGWATWPRAKAARR